MVFEAHDKAFAFFGGACQRGIYDSETLFAIGSRTMDDAMLGGLRPCSSQGAKFA